MSLLGLTVFGFGTAFVNTFRQYLFFRFGVSQALVCYAISSVCLGEAQLPGRGMGRGFPLGAHRGRGLPPPPPRAPRGRGQRGAWLARKEGEPAGLMELQSVEAGSGGRSFHPQRPGDAGESVLRLPFHPHPPSWPLIPHTFPVIPLVFPWAPHGLYVLSPSDCPGLLLNPLYVLSPVTVTALSSGGTLLLPL